MEQPLIDLAKSDESLRKERWSASLRRLFPGVEVIEMPDTAVKGTVHGSFVDTARFWHIDTVAQSIAGKPVNSTNPDHDAMKVLIQMAGEAHIHQQGRTAVLTAGCFAFIDASRPFQLTMPSSFNQALIQLPRHAVIKRYPGIERRTAIASEPGHPGDELFMHYMTSLAAHGGGLHDGMAKIRSIIALLELLGNTRVLSRKPAAAHLLDRAFTLIDMHLSHEDFSSEMLAMQLNISRRYLNRLFCQRGTTVGQEIKERRLLRAAQLLASAGKNTVRILDLCFMVGFRDPAHFSRSFKKRFGMSPSQWRNHRLG